MKIVVTYFQQKKLFQNEVTKEKLKFYKKKTVYFSNFEQELSILIWIFFKLSRTYNLLYLR